jgi:CubicO group peptidase (beta-lactamase class C family)
MKIARALVFLFALACASTTRPPAQWQQWATPEDAGFDATALEETRAFADKTQSGAVMVVYRGRVLTAWGDVARKLELHSVRKSLYAAMYGIAVEKGLIDLDTTLAALGVDDLEPLTGEEKKARVEDLLYARSGVYHPAAYAASDQDAGRPARGSHAPGTHWFYNNWDFNVAGALLERAAKKPLGVLFDEWIAQPIGMQDFEPGDVHAFLEPRTSQWPALTFRMSTRDLARFGALWLARGRWGDRQVIPAAWIDRASESRSPMSVAGQGYAMMWWTYAPDSLPAERYPHARRHRILQARGTGGQMVAIIPDLDLVFVHRGDTDHGRQVNGRNVWMMLEQILAARRGDARAEAKSVALQPVALASQLPPFEWPRIITLDPATRNALLGRYRFAPNIVATVYEYDGRLFVSMPGQGEAELSAISPSEFFVRVDPTAAVRFDGEKVIALIEGREMVGTREREP